MLMADDGLLFSLGDCQCSACNVPLPEGMGVMLKTCLHPFCKPCLVDMIQSSSDFEIMCPAAEGGEPLGAGAIGTRLNRCNAGGYITMDEVMEILGPESAELQAYLARASASADSAVCQNSANKRKLNEPGQVSAKQIKITHPAEHDPGRCGHPADRGDSGNRNPAGAGLLRAEISSECSFCAEELGVGQGIILQGCLHVFCQECLRQVIQSSKQAKVKCPFTAPGETCAGFIQNREVKELLSAEEFEVYLQRSLKEAESHMNTFHCCTLHCAGFCELDPNNNKSVFLCSVCSKMNCLLCKVVHDGMDCAKYQEITANMSSTSKNNRKSIQRVVSNELTGGWDQLSQLVKASPQSAVTHDSVLANLGQHDLLPSTKVFECPICFKSIRVGKGVILQDCLHTFCRACLIATITHSEDPAVKCPYMDANISCMSFVSPREIKALVPGNVYEAYLNRSIKLAELVNENSFHCVTPNCEGWCITDDNSRFFLCPVCDKVNCLKCKALHEDYTCEQYKHNLVADNANRVLQRKNELKGEAVVQKALKDRKYVKCPRCKIVCQKISGCNHVTCGACRFNFNWTGRFTLHWTYYSQNLMFCNRIWRPYEYQSLTRSYSWPVKLRNGPQPRIIS